MTVELKLCQFDLDQVKRLRHARNIIRRCHSDALGGYEVRLSNPEFLCDLEQYLSILEVLLTEQHKPCPNIVNPARTEANDGR